MKTKKPKATFVVEKSSTGFSAYWVWEAGNSTVATTGGDLTELKANMLEAANLAVENFGFEFTAEEIGYQMDLPQFFEYYSELNVKGLARRVGLNRSLLAQYIGGQKKPSEKQTAKILEGIRGLGRELASLELA